MIKSIADDSSEERALLMTKTFKCFRKYKNGMFSRFGIYTINKHRFLGSTERLLNVFAYIDRIDFL